VSCLLLYAIRPSALCCVLRVLALSLVCCCVFASAAVLWLFGRLPDPALYGTYAAVGRRPSPLPLRLRTLHEDARDGSETTLGTGAYKLVA